MSRWLLARKSIMRREPCMSSIRRLSRGSMELRCFYRQACSTKDGALASDCHVGKLLLLDKKAPSRLLRGDSTLR